MTTEKITSAPAPKVLTKRQRAAKRQLTVRHCGRITVAR